MKHICYFALGLLIVLISIFVFIPNISAQNSEVNKKKATQNRKKEALIPDPSESIPYQWTLDHIYTDEAAWKKDFEKLKTFQGGMSAYKKNLTTIAIRLLEGLKLRDEINLLAHQLQYWAEKRVQKSVTDATRQDLVSQISRLYAKLSAEQAFIDAALLALEPDAINDFMALEPELVVFKPHLDNLLRTRSIQLSPDAASLIAQAGDVLDFSQSMFKAIKQDLIFAPVKDEKGNPEGFCG